MGIARRGLSTKTTLILLALFFGVLACPIQAIYCIGFSGKSIGTHEIVVGEPMTLQLSPEMNPIRLVGTLQYEHPRNVMGLTESTYFNASLSQDDSECWTQRFGVQVEDEKEDDSGGSGISITVSRNGTYPSVNITNIHSFNIESSGDYSFLVAPTSENDLKVNDVSVTVRKNVRQVNVPIAVVGGIMLALGVIVGIVSLFLNQPKHQLHSAKN